jgi:hypothetical protein
MITENRVLEIINNNDPGKIEKIQVIIRYIFDKTNEDISGINIHPPDNMKHSMLFDHMYNIAKQFYRNEKK